MKMTEEHYNELYDMCADQHGNSDLAVIYDGYVWEGKSAMRFRWDIFWAIPIERRTPWTEKVYKYLNDDHIDSALKKIVKSLLTAQENA